MNAAETGSQLEAWCGSEPGRYLTDAEQVTLDRHLARTAGYRAMLLKVTRSTVQVDAAPQLHKFVLAPRPGSGVTALADTDALPLPSDVVELAVLHHVLDCSEYPHEALKEGARVVQASGHLIVIGYNPWSFFGLWRVFGRLFGRHAIWHCRCLSVARVTDWLKLVGFHAEKVSYGEFRPPLRSPRLLAKLGWLDRGLARLHLPLGNYYVISARKMRLRPIRGKQEWLARAMKPVKLTSRSQVKTRVEKH